MGYLEESAIELSITNDAAQLQQFGDLLSDYLAKNTSDAARFLDVALKYGLIHLATNYNITPGSTVFLTDYERSEDYQVETIIDVTKATFIIFHGQQYIIDTEQNAVLSLNAHALFEDRRVRRLFVLDEESLASLNLETFKQFFFEAASIVLTLPEVKIGEAHNYRYMPKTEFNHLKPGDNIILIAKNGKEEPAVGIVSEVGMIDSIYYQNHPIIEKRFGLRITIPMKLKRIIKWTREHKFFTEDNIPYYIFVRNSEIAEL